MAFTDVFLPEFDQEMRTTRSILERVPLDNAAWKPHTKSSSLGALASHVAQLVGFAVNIVRKTEIDMAPPGGGPPRPRPQYQTTDELLGAFDANVQEARAAIGELTEQDLATPWSLKMGDHTIFTLPRTAALRTMMMNHIIHHRGQLSVYLRLNDVPLPSIYGPTADS